MLTKEADALRTAEEPIELIENTDAAAGERGEGGAGDAKLGERPQAEDEARIEDKIDDVGYPEQTHGDGRITRAAEDGVIEKEQHDRAAAAEGNARVAGADCDDLRGSAHQAKQARRIKKTGKTNNGRDCEAEDDSLNSCDGGASGIFFADAAGDHGGGGEAEPEANGKNQAEKRFGEADRGNGVRSKTADPENVDDGEEGFQHHFEDHWNGQEENGAIEVASGEVLARAADGFTDRAPQPGSRRCGDSLLHFHVDLCSACARPKKSGARTRLEESIGNERTS